MLRKTMTSAFARFASTFSGKAPTKLYSVHGRYATALFSAASKTSKLKEVESEITKVKTYIVKNPKVLAVLENPAIGRDAKKKMIDTLFAKQKYSDLTINMFRVLAEYGRLDNTMKVIASFEQLMKEHNSIVPVQIISNQSLSQDMKTKLEGIVQKKFIGCDKKSSITWKVDEKIMGGLIIEVGDNVVDLSVASKAASISKELMSSL